MLIRSVLYVCISIILVVLGYKFYTVQEVIIGLLELLIVIEIVRMIANFISDTHHKINMRYAVDGAIIYMLHELYIVLANFRSHPALCLQIIIYMLCIYVFIKLRTIVIDQQSSIFKNDF